MHGSNFVIHKAGRGYYRPHAKGYTVDLSEAGRFTHSDAVAYSHPNGSDGPRDGIRFFHIDDVESDNCELEVEIFNLKRERDNLRTGMEMVTEQLSNALAKIETLEAERSGIDKAIEFTNSMDLRF